RVLGRLEEVVTLRGVVERAAIGQGRRVDGTDGLAGRPRVTGEGNLVLVLRLEQVAPVGRAVRDGRLVDLEGHDAVVVAVPVAVGVLELGIDRVPDRDLV